jgi:hypothetical protein
VAQRKTSVFSIEPSSCLYADRRKIDFLRGYLFLRSSGRRNPACRLMLFMQSAAALFLPALFPGPFHTKPGMGKSQQGDLFFFFYQDHKIAIPAVAQMQCICSLNPSAAERAGDHPAGAARIVTIVDAIEIITRGCRANAELVCFAAAWLPTAAFVLPTIQFHHAFSYLSPCGVPAYVFCAKSDSIIRQLFRVQQSPSFKNVRNERIFPSVAQVT